MALQRERTGSSVNYVTLYYCTGTGCIGTNTARICTSTAQYSPIQPNTDSVQYRFCIGIVPVQLNTAQYSSIQSNTAQYSRKLYQYRAVPVQYLYQYSSNTGSRTFWILRFQGRIQYSSNTAHLYHCIGNRQFCIGTVLVQILYWNCTGTESVLELYWYKVCIGTVLVQPPNLTHLT